MKLEVWKGGIDLELWRFLRYVLDDTIHNVIMSAEVAVYEYMSTWITIKIKKNFFNFFSN